MEKDLERLTELTCFRAESRLESAIGPDFNNETLMLVNAVSKARASIDLLMEHGSDAGHGIIFSVSAEGFPLPLDLILTKSLRSVEFEMLDGEPTGFADEFLVSCRLGEERKKAVKAEIAALGKSAKLSYRKKMDRGIWQAAKRYHLMMTSPVMDFEYAGLLARLYLYRDLMAADERLAGMNIEQALLIRREEHNRIVKEGTCDEMVLFIAECLLEAVYAGADRLELASRSANMSAEYLSSRMEKGKSYTMKEIADILGMRTEMAATLFVLPALTSDRMAVEPHQGGEDLYRLIG